MKNKKFKAKRGQMDYTNARWAPVINCVLSYRGKILVLKRSEKLRFYPGRWNGISGFLDDRRTLQEKVREEVKEETGISARNISTIKLGRIFHQDASRYGKTWIVHPVLVRVKTDTVWLDWESAEYRWMTFREAGKLKLLPGFKKVIENVSSL